MKRLIGDVIMMHEGATLYCDSAYFYTEANNVEAFGHIRINSGTVKIKSDLLTYDGNSKDAKLHRNVSLTDEQMTLVTEHLTYNTRTNISEYYTGGKITDPEYNLTSVVGYYYANDKQFFFKNNVKLVNPQYTMLSDTLMNNTETDISYFYGPTTIVSKENTIYCENGWYDKKKDIALFNEHAYLKNKEQKINGDSLYYDRNTGLGKAYNNITIFDSLQKIILKGDYAEYWEKEGNTMITQKALLIQDAGDDSLYLHADTLKAAFDSTGAGKTVYAYNNAKYFKSDLQGLADSIVYSVNDSTIFMYSAPILWTEKNQLTADTILIFLSNNQIKRMNLYSSSFVIMQDDSVRFNQVKGKNLTGYFTDNHLTRIDVKSNGETLYYVRDEINGLIGVNKAIADDLLIYANDNEIKTITFISKPEAVLYPEKELGSEDVKLKNFKWEIFKRPMSKEDVFR